MKMKELQEKTEQELHKLLAETRDAVRILRFKIAAKQTGGVREIRKERKLIAQILTLLSQQKKK